MQRVIGSVAVLAFLVPLTRAADTLGLPRLSVSAAVLERCAVSSTGAQAVKALDSPADWSLPLTYFSVDFR